MIKLNNVAIGYNGVAIRENLCYTFEDNQIYGILGESGIGKTTLLKTIAGLLKPISGEIIRDVPTKEIFMMHQAYTCFDWLDCEQNVLITEKVKGHKITKSMRDDAVYLLDKVGLGQHVGKINRTYPTQLSGGQRQRLALARTLFSKPKIILMDEPLSALDERTRSFMQNLILSHQRQYPCTILMVTHSQSEARLLCNDIISF